MCKDCENNINMNEELEQENMSLEDMDKEQLLDNIYNTDRDYIIDSKKALELGIIDEIL